jgi:hypothetical protein
MCRVIHIRSLLIIVTRLVLLVAFATGTLAIAARHRPVDGHQNRVHVVPAALSDNCESTCNDTFIKAVQEECDYHKKVVKEECGGNFVCHRDENYRHRVALQTILIAHKTCRNGCSPQAVGTGGT